MRKQLIKWFVKNSQDIHDPKVRESYGRLAGIVGIVSNAFLCGLKLMIGVLTNSIAIIADGVNNLADASSSIITLIGFKMAAKPGDQEHPYGHARIEYLTGLFISIFILLLGIKLLTSSFQKVLFPDPLNFQYITVAALLLSIAIKVWQGLFYFKMGDDIGSSTLKATGVDSRNDVIATTAVLVGLIAGKLIGVQLDGYMGCVVALFILYSGVQLIKETASPLLGKAPDPELISRIQREICSEDGVLGIHDLVVHDYGPGRIFASVHVEVDAYGDLIESHDMIDRIERTISQQLNIHLVIHMDPLETKDPATIQLKEIITETLTEVHGVLSIHDLRIVAGYQHSNVIFDIVLAPECNTAESSIKKIIEDRLSQLEKTYYTVITFDKNYLPHQHD